MTVAGATATTEGLSGAGSAAVTLRLTAQSEGQPRPVRGVVGRRSRAGWYLAGTLFDA
jgi:hypothetical protein